MALLLVAGAIVGGLANSLISPPTASAQAPGTMGRIRVFTWNTETDTVWKSEMPGDYDRAGRKGRECPSPYLRYHISKVKFLPVYAKREKLDIVSLQEMNAICPGVRLTTDGQGRSIPDYTRDFYDGDKTKAVVEEYKRWFKDGYSHNGKQGRSMTDAAFEQELQSVFGRKTFEDVWVRFLPFDTVFWTAANMTFVEGYPMQATTKIFEDEKTQWFRVAIFSRFPYYKTPNLMGDGTIPYMLDRDVYPLPGLKNQGREPANNPGKDTRWVVIAPLDTMFGNLHAASLHPRAGEETKVGIERIFEQAELRWGEQNASGPLYIMGGDYNAGLHDDWYDARDLYEMEGGGIDWWAIPKSRLARLRFVPDSLTVLVATGGGRAPDVPGSDHNGMLVDLEGPIIKAQPPLVTVTMPDYFPHEKDDVPPGGNPQQPPITAPVGPDQCTGGFLEDFQAIRAKPNVSGMLLFSPFGDNPDPNFQKHLIPAGFIPQICGAATCAGSKVGINPGTIYGGPGKERPAQHGFDWFLQIAEADKPGNVAETINALPANTQAIIRIGIADNGLGFGTDPGQYTAFLATVWGQLSAEKKATTWAIAGPNEPDIEWKWFAPECAPGHGSGPNDPASTAFYACVGPKLSSYMNAVIDGNPGFKLLSPAFNMTSYTLQGIFGAMNTSGARWSDLAAISGNLYPAGAPMTQHWQTNGIDQLLATAGKPLVITETGVGGLQCDIADEIQRDNYYITPIKGVGGSGNDALNTIRDDLISQGYRAACLGGGFRVSATVSGLEAMNILFDQPLPHNNSAILGGLNMPRDRAYLSPFVYSVLTADYRDTLYPLYRDPDSPGVELKQSLETYFSHKVLSSGDYYGNIEINSAAINSLVTNPQRCGLSYLNLLSRDAMCKKLADPNSCSLYGTTIPGSSYTARTLLGVFESYYQDAREERDNPDLSIIDACQMLMSDSDTSVQSLKMGMRNAPLEMEEAYRLGFAVTTIRLRVPNPSTYTNLFTHPLGGWLGPPKPRHDVLVTAFKIPDILTNKGAIDDGLKAVRTEEGVPNYLTTLRQGTSGNTSYLDPAILTRNSLIPNEAAFVYERQQRCQREVFQAAARRISMLVQDDGWAEIECLGASSGVFGVGGPVCKDPLSKALVDMINTQALLEPITAGTGDFCALNPETIANQVVAATGGDASLGDLTPPPGSDGLTPEQIEHLRQLANESVDDEGDFTCFSQSETSEFINDPGSLQPVGSAGHLFTDEWGAAFLENLFAKDDCTHGGDGGGDPSYASTQPGGSCGTGLDDWHLKSKFYVTPTENAPGGGTPLAVKQFIVYPIGYDLRTVEGVLAGSFFSTEQLATLLRKALSYDHVRMDGDDVDFNGGSDSFSFTEERRPPQETTCREVEKERTLPDGSKETYYDYECPTYTMAFRLEQLSGNKPNAILGGRLGYWMRTIQRSLVTTNMKTWEYLATCTSTQEFLLDICGKTPAVEDGWDPLPQPPDPPALPIPPAGDNIWVYGVTIPDTSFSGKAINAQDPSESYDLTFQNARVHSDNDFDTRVVRFATRVPTKLTVTIPWEIDTGFITLMSPTQDLPFTLVGNTVTFEIPAKDPKASAYVLKTHNRRNPAQTLVFFVDDYNEVPHDDVPIPGAVVFDPDNEAAIQPTIDSSPAGTKFYFPRGTYEIERILIENRQDLHFIFNPNAVINLQQPPDRANQKKPSIHINKSDNISFQGPGYIYASENVFPNMFVASDSSNISLNDFFVYGLKREDGGGGPVMKWVNVGAATDVRSITEQGAVDPVDGSTNITYNRMFLTSTDDAISMKTRSKSHMLNGFHMTNSFAKSSSSALKVGQDSIETTITNVMYKDSTTFDSDRNLIVSPGNGNGNVGNILYSNIRVRWIKSSGRPRAIELSKKDTDKRDNDGYAGSNIVFEKIDAIQAAQNVVSHGHATIKDSIFRVPDDDYQVFNSNDCGRLTLLRNRVVLASTGEEGGRLGCDQEEEPPPPVPDDPAACVSTPADLVRIGYTNVSILPDAGVATYYDYGVFAGTLRNRLNGRAGDGMVGNTTINNCELTPEQMADPSKNPNPTLSDGTKFIGCAALVRLGDLTFNAGGPNDVRKIWVKSVESGEVLGPIAVIDVAAERDAACLFDGKRHGGKHWSVDLNRSLHARLFNNIAGPRDSVVCDSLAQCQ